MFAFTIYLIMAIITHGVCFAFFKNDNKEEMEVNAAIASILWPLFLTFMIIVCFIYYSGIILRMMSKPITKFVERCFKNDKTI